MKSAQCRVSFCSRCRFYAPEGRRGGQCSQLGVPVESRWKPCPLAVPVFTPPLVPMTSLERLPQPLELGFPTVIRDAARLEAALEAPAVIGHLEDTIPPISAQVWR